MPSASSRSVSSIYQDSEGILRALRELAEAALARHPELERVILFGSFARGDFGLYSDADLLLVLSRSELDRFFERIPDFIDDFLSAPIPVDVFPYTADELRRMLETDNTFIRRMLEEGEVLATRV